MRAALLKRGDLVACMSTVYARRTFYQPDGNIGLQHVPIPKDTVGVVTKFIVQTYSDVEMKSIIAVVEFGEARQRVLVNERALTLVKRGVPKTSRLLRRGQ